MIAPVNHQSNTAGKSPTRRQAWEIATSRLEDEAGQYQMGFAERVTDTVGRHPLVALAAATAIGTAIGWLVKRKL